MCEIGFAIVDDDEGDISFASLLTDVLQQESDLVMDVDTCGHIPNLILLDRPEKLLSNPILMETKLDEMLKQLHLNSKSPGDFQDIALPFNWITKFRELMLREMGTDFIEKYKSLVEKIRKQYQKHIHKQPSTREELKQMVGK